MVQRWFKEALKGILVREGYPTRRQSREAAAGIAELLLELEEKISDPRQGIEHLIAVFEADDKAVACGDDSDGEIGDVYRTNVTGLFSKYAQRLDDKDWIAGVVFDLAAGNEYGCRDALVERTTEFLPEVQVRRMIDRMFAEIDASPKMDKFDPTASRLRTWEICIEVFAERLIDPRLYERACHIFEGPLSAHSMWVIASLWLKAGDAETALAWTERAEAKERDLRGDRVAIKLAILEKLGRRDAMCELANRQFIDDRTKEHLDVLVKIAGESSRETIVKEALSLIRASTKLDSDDAYFLLDCGLHDEAANYVISRWDSARGVFYGSAIPIAEMFDDAGKLLASTVMYRGLVESVLDRGLTASYPHGVRYLRKLDAMAPKIADWGPVARHTLFLQSLRELTKAKRSFWAKYDGKQRS